MPTRGLNLLVFRDGTREANGSELKNALAQQLRLLQTSPSPDAVLTALLQAGELESSLADFGIISPEWEAITASLSVALVRGKSPSQLNSLIAPLNGLSVPRILEVSVPEGFAFYALHPLAYADVLEEFRFLPSRIVVIGIRSIGTTLSAVTMAALQARGIQALRMTVRPTGHPYNRRTEFSAEQLRLLQREVISSGMFLVVDEGPGLSGSSFLSVAEALVKVGISPEKITLLCSHAADPDRLCAENAANRWRRFRSVVVPSSSRRPAAAQVWIGGGEWRSRCLRDQSARSASWTSFESLKYLSGQNAEPRFYKFVGFGSYGKEVIHREEQVARAGFGPLPQSEGDGYASYPFLDGYPMSVHDLSPCGLARMAAYCAFRARAFPADPKLAALQQMAEHNLCQLGFAGELTLHLERGVIPDGRMQPHEWMLTNEGRMLKTDSGGHGDDHFFPGASDIAWDLAGAIVEWRMSQAQAENFLALYHRASGDDARNRIADFITAYAIFRCAYCTMAANAMQGTEEQARLQKAAADYGATLLKFQPQIFPDGSSTFLRA